MWYEIKMIIRNSNKGNSEDADVPMIEISSATHMEAKEWTSGVTGAAAVQGSDSDWVLGIGTMLFHVVAHDTLQEQKEHFKA